MKTQTPPDVRQPQSGQQAALLLLRDELQPAISDLHSIAREASSLRVGFVASLSLKEIEALEYSYTDAMLRFMTAYRKWSFPDEMFRGATDAEKVQMLSDFMGIKSALGKHIDEGFRLLEYIDRTLSGHKSTAYNRIAMFLSIGAITISIVVAFV